MTKQSKSGNRAQRRALIGHPIHTRGLLSSISALILAALSSGCVVSENPSPPSGGTGASVFAQAGTGSGTGGADNVSMPAQPEPAGAAGQAPVAPPPGPPPVMCGSRACVPPVNLADELLRQVLGLQPTLPSPVGCCIDPVQGTCGSAATPSAICEGPAVRDERCPGVDLSALVALLGKDTHNSMVGGCCTPSGCGIDGVLFGRGCVENSEMARMVSAVPVVGPYIVVPAPARCEHPQPAPGAGDDAGV